jgi:hypothetical protein
VLAVRADDGAALTVDGERAGGLAPVVDEAGVRVELGAEVDVAAK